MVPNRNRPVSTICMSVLAVFLLTFHPAKADVPPPAKERGGVRVGRKKEVCGRVGNVFIIGNTLSPDSIILRAIHLSPGEEFTLADLRSAERNLARLKIFKDDPAPLVRIIDREGDSTYKDIRVDVSERDGNVYFWAMEESLEFTATWVARGLPAAIFEAKRDGFPFELICFTLTAGRTGCPFVISQLFTR
jgi:hypothetical protein